MNKVSAYRPDIDGLRAIAVLGVLFYHAGIGLPGGYVGVDVFYVISGYLITQIISTSIDSQTFSIRNFWVRRFRRILPASLFVTLATLAAGAVLLLPYDFHELGEAAFAHSIMLSNVYHWDQLRGYFAAESELRPLLHTWSLSVEEQFYLIYPVLLLALAKLRINLNATLGLLAIASLGLSEFVVRWNAETAFFHLPFRAWELIVGGLAFTCRRRSAGNAGTANMLSVAGAVLIVGSMLFYDADTLFPGMSAMAPVFGAVMLIWANTAQRTVVGQLLSLRPFVVVGLLSYSIYLWHWPVFVFARYIFGSDLSGPIIAASLSLVALLSALSWYFVETPFRRRTGSDSPAKVIGIGAGTAMLVGFVGLFIVLTDGVPARFAKSDKLVLEDAGFESSRFFRKDPASVPKGLPRIGSTNPEQEYSVILVGDSHATPVVGLLDELLRKSQLSGLVAAKSATPPIIEIESSLHPASIWNETVLEFIKQESIQTVIIVSRWSTWLNDDRVFDEVQGRLNALAQRGSQIWLLKPTPEIPFNGARAIYATRFGAKPRRGGTLEEHLHKHRLANGYLDRLQSDAVRVLDASGNFFAKNGAVTIGSGERSYFRDNDHLSTYGAKVLLAPVLEKALNHSR